MMAMLMTKNYENTDNGDNGDDDNDENTNGNDDNDDNDGWITCSWKVVTRLARTVRGTSGCPVNILHCDDDI